MAERSNFHEDDLRHYWLKAENAREDGCVVGCAPRKPARKSSMQWVLKNATRLDLHTRTRLEELTGHKRKPNPLDVFLSKFPPEQQAALRRALEE